MRRLALTTLALTSCFAAFGCAKEPKDGPPVAREHIQEGTPSGKVNVTVTFPSDAVKGVTNSVHIYVLDQSYVGDSGPANCGDLVGTGLDPYSTTLNRTGDLVVKRTDPASTPFDSAMTVTGVESGKSFVYVEAVDYGGQVEWAGCVQVTVGGGTTSAAVTLAKAGVYKCDDPTTKNGAPCDDGKLCTVGEKCENGQCTGGITRDCTALTDACNAGTCDETKGCYQNPLTNGSPCDDSDSCTVNDACTAGKCTGSPRNCLLELDSCVATAKCEFGYCQALTYKAAGTTCDDGSACTVGEQCYGSSSYSYCSGGVTCPGTNDPYDYCGGYCSGNTCIYPTGSYCYTGNTCLTNETCSSTGACTGGTPVDCSGNAGSCYSTTCDPTYGCSKAVATGTSCDPGTFNCAYYGYAGTAHCYQSSTSYGICEVTPGSVGSYGCY